MLLENLNHNPTPSKAMPGKEYMIAKLTMNVRRKLFNYFEVGVRVPQIHGILGFLAHEKTGLDNMSITKKDIRHVVEEKLKLRMESRKSL